MDEFEIIFYEKADGTEPAKDFLLSLDIKMRAKMFRTIDWVIGLATIWFGFGIIYFIIIAIMRHDEKNRETICPNCGEKNSAMDVY